MKMENIKKINRKSKRFSARLESCKGIKCVDTPGRNIILCNVGQATGLVRADILKIIENTKLEIPLPKFIAEKGETYSFLVFDDTETAVLFYNTLNGKAKVNENGSVIYMNFVEKVPDTQSVREHENPKGLLVLNEFITPVEEQKFIKLFDWTSTSETSNLKNRQVKHYGYEFRYGTNDVDLNSPLIEKIPDECNILWKRLKESGLDLGVPDQLTVNKYSPGQGIPLHVDTHSPFGDTILSLSLGSDVLMDWVHHTGTQVPVLVRARSMLVMQHEARYAWRHGIRSRTYDPVVRGAQYDNSTRVHDDVVPRSARISLTFRWTRAGECTCTHRALCDSTTRTDLMKREAAAQLEELHVHQVYERIAEHFSTTRHKPWPRVVQFVRAVPPGGVLIDLGSGNGKNILDRSDIIQLAGERSGALLEACRVRCESVPGAADCVRLDMLAAPLADECADAVLCIAVVHHLSSEARRLQAIASIHRLLRKGGRALITVWAKDQSHSNYLKSADEGSTETADEALVSVDGAAITLPVHRNRTQFKHNDLLVPWKLRCKTDNKLSNTSVDTLLRYYHVFDEKELDRLCAAVGLHVHTSYYEEGNWCVVCIKQ